MELEINKLLSRKMRVKPLAEGEVATFRLINALKVEPRSKMPIRKAFYSLYGHANVTDVESGARVMLQNIASHVPVRMPDRTIQWVPQEERVRFGNMGTLRLGHGQNNTYAFLARHPLNDSNPFAPIGGRRVFYQVDALAEAKKSMAADSLELEARVLVRDSTLEDLKPMAKALGVSLDIGPEEIRHALNQRAKKSPAMLIRASKNMGLKALVLIEDALDSRLIGFDEQSREWFWNDGEEKEGFYVVEAGIESKKALAGYLIGTDNRAGYRRLVGKLHQAKHYIA